MFTCTIANILMFVGNGITSNGTINSSSAFVRSTYSFIKGLMSALEAFVSEQKKKANASSLSSGFGSASFSSFGDLRSKLSSSLSGLPLLSRSETADSQPLTDDVSVDGQLPNAKNRKNGGWFSSGDEGFCGMSRTQRIFAFFLSLLGALFCFSTVSRPFMCFTCMRYFLDIFPVLVILSQAFVLARLTTKAAVILGISSYRGNTSRPSLSTVFVFRNGMPVANTDTRTCKTSLLVMFVLTVFQHIRVFPGKWLCVKYSYLLFVLLH
ncbi:hypothetical protein ANCCAN_07548 [Ancylostoma caninum]|uniref:Uncharacterized protein n=1 Tax=Ancylostoma caninum TaxID=29170 RepID=A0A368GTJ4_ANCCA|nr:hypothetical protein ANCCAN_07548 [Ancylostoma caninum]